MKFEQAYLQMLKGKKVARPCFEGYWCIEGYKGKLNIHTREGKTLETGELDLTVKNCLAEDWEVIK